MKDGKKLLAELGELEPKHGLLPHAQPADLRRRHAGPQVGLAPAPTPRTRRASRSTTGRSSTASSTPTSSAACGPTSQIGFMPKALSRQARAVPAQVDARAPYDEIYTGWAYPPKDYDEVGRAGLPVGEALRREVRPGRGRDVVLGGLERAEHRLLARHARGVPQAARLRHRRRAPGPADGPGRRPGHGGRAARSCASSSSTACAGRTTRPARRARPLDFVAFHAKGAPQFVDGHVRMGIANQLAGDRRGLRDRSPRSRS